MQAGSGGNIGRVEKRLGLNLYVGGGRLKLYRDICLLMSNGLSVARITSVVVADVALLGESGCGS